MMRVYRVLAAVLVLFSWSSLPVRAGQPQILTVQFRSTLLSQFAGHDVFMYATVLLPDSFYTSPGRRYPVMYWVPAFDTFEALYKTFDIPESTEIAWQKPMRALHREFIVVSLDGMIASGHQEFANSANNGPWGDALVQEFIPALERRFRGIGTAETRFVSGHSSGGWSALWLQVNYPDFFGGEWSIAPDPVDFRDFTGPDITRNPPQNFYVDDRANPYLEGCDGPRLCTLRDLVRTPGWGPAQFHSFDAVFSPKGSDGKPEHLFNWSTGEIDPGVARYWEDHYDISKILRDRWSELGPKLQGKLHVIVGTNDEFHLQDSVHLLADELHALHSDAQIDFVQAITGASSILKTSRAESSRKRLHVLNCPIPMGVHCPGIPRFTDQFSPGISGCESVAW